MLQKNFSNPSQTSKDPIMVDTYRSPHQSKTISIDASLDRVHCFQINSFNFKVGDCLFDTIHFLLHGQYTPNELRNGLLNHFLHSLHNGSVEAIHYSQHELHPSILYDLHNIYDKKIYFRRMRISSIEVNKHGEGGLWGDIFYIWWLKH